MTTADINSANNDRTPPLSAAGESENLNPVVFGQLCRRELLAADDFVIDHDRHTSAINMHFIQQSLNAGFAVVFMGRAVDGKIHTRQNSEVSIQNAELNTATTDDTDITNIRQSI